MSASPIHTRSLVLAHEAAVEELHGLASAQGWRPAHAIRAGFTEKTRLDWDVGHDAESGTTVGYREEHYSGIRTVTAAGADERQVEHLAAVLAANLPTVPETAVLDRLLDDTEATPLAAVRGIREWAAFHYAAGLTDSVSVPFDPRYRRVIERHVAHPNRQVRLTAMLVADQLARIWPESREPVIARKGVEVELDHLVDAFIEEAAK